MNASQASNTLKEKNLNISIEGSGTVISQDAAKDEKSQKEQLLRLL